MYPSDPRQLENKLYQYVLAHYQSMFLYYWLSWGKKNDQIPTPSDVHKYIFDRANGCPFRQAVLIELWYPKISKLMQISARVGK